MQRFQPIIILASAIAWTACGADPSSSAIQSALNQDFGGLTTEDEESQFGEDQEFDAIGESSEDPMPPSTDAGDIAAEEEASTAEAEVRDEISTTDRGAVYALRITWGRQRVAEAAADGTIWNPTISTNCGGLAVRRLVKMEQGEGVVRPRTDPQSVSFTSATRPHYDGVVLALGVRATNRDCMSTGALTIATDGLLSGPSAGLVIPFADLTDHVEHIDAGNGNSIVILAHRVEPRRGDACVRGTMGGRWIRAEEDPTTSTSGTANPNEPNGRFRGRVMDELGELMGHVKGVYGVPDAGRFAGKRVFFGKYIRLDGTFSGLLAGRYRDGNFAGGWHTARRFSDLRGMVGGHYAEAPNDDREGGLFRGRFASLGCVNRATTDEPLATTDP